MEDSTILSLLTLLCIQWFVCQIQFHFLVLIVSQKSDNRESKNAISESCPGLLSRVILNFWELYIFCPSFSLIICPRDRADKNGWLVLASAPYTPRPGIEFRISSGVNLEDGAYAPYASTLDTPRAILHILYCNLYYFNVEKYSKFIKSWNDF